MVLILEDFYQNRDARLYEEYAPSIRATRGGLKVVEITNTTADELSPALKSTYYKLGYDNFLPGGFGGDTQEQG